MVVELEMNRRGIAQIAVGDELRDACRAVVVERALPFAVKKSPRDKTRVYVESWRVSPGFTVIAGMRRVAVKLVNIADHAAAVEWGRGGKAGVLAQTLAHLHGTTVEEMRASRRRRAFDPGRHPRDARGRFVARED